MDVDKAYQFHDYFGFRSSQTAFKATGNGQPGGRLARQTDRYLVITPAYVAVPPCVVSLQPLQLLREEAVEGAQAEVLQHLAWGMRTHRVAGWRSIVLQHLGYVENKAGRAAFSPRGPGEPNGNHANATLTSGASGMLVSSKEASK